MIETVGELKERLKDIPDDYSIYGMEYFNKGYLSKINDVQVYEGGKKAVISLEERSSEKID